MAKYRQANTKKEGVDIWRSTDEQTPKRKELIFGKVQTRKISVWKELIFDKSTDGQISEWKELIFDKSTDGQISEWKELIFDKSTDE